MKRFVTVVLMLLAAVLMQAQTADPSFALYIAKTELNGDVKLVWTKPLLLNGHITYEVYRAKVSDSASFTLIKTTDDNYMVDQVPSVVTSIGNSYAYYVLGKANGTTVKSNVQLLPVPPLPPLGAFRLEGRITDTGTVKLTWQKPALEGISHYIVRGGNAAIAAPMLPRLDSTTGLSSVQPIPVAPGTTEPVVLAYYVVAHLTGGDIVTSTFLQLTVHPKLNRDGMKFTSVPPKYGQTGKPYLYTAVAVSSDPAAVVRYSGRATLGLLTVETGFAIDSVTGAVNWTPALKGYYQVSIMARSSKGGAAKQEFTVGVAGGNGVIKGKVTDTLNAPVPNVLVELFKTDNISFAYSAKTDENGNYVINRVDPGSYKLKANAPSPKFQSQWYDGKRDAFQADVIAVQDSPAVTIANMKLRGGPGNLPKVTVTGSVKDTLGLAINGGNTRVVFVRAEFALNIGAGATIATENFRRYFELNAHGDFRLEGSSEHVVKGSADSLGNFSVKLVPGAYIAFARSHGYSTEFFHEKADLLSADVIRVQADTSGIHFTLAPLPPVVLGGISGTVTDSVSDVPVPARVIAFRDGWRFNDQHRIARAYVTDTDSAGAYEFTELLPGTYVVMAVPLGNYAPAFYTATDTTAARWKRAAKIVINGNSVDGIDIFVKPMASAVIAGYGSVFGTVNVNGQNGGSAKAGGIVYVYRNGAVAGYALTDPNGNYSINGLAPGQYVAFVDKPGFNESSVVSVNVSYDIATGNPMSGRADFTISGTTSVTFGETVTPASFTLEQNYPNPFNPSTNIRYALPSAGAVTLKVYDLIGREVATLVNGFQPSGQYTVSFNASSLASGVYLYRLETGASSQVRKMVLMK